MSLTTPYCAVLVLLVLIKLSHSFDVRGFCHDRCLRGSGGVLCRCNAVHFAGKRTMGPPNGRAPSASLHQGVSPDGRQEFLNGAEASRNSQGFPPYSISYTPPGDALGTNTPLELNKPMGTGSPTRYGLVNTGYFPKTPSSVFVDGLTRSSNGAADNNADGSVRETLFDTSHLSWKKLNRAELLLDEIHRARERNQRHKGNEKSYDKFLPEYLPLLIMGKNLDPSSVSEDRAYGRLSDLGFSTPSKQRGRGGADRIQLALSRAFGQSLHPLQRSSRAGSPHHPA